MSAAACVAQFVNLAEQDLAQPANGEVTDQELAAVLTAAVRLYALRCEVRDIFPAPLIAEKVTATDVATVVSEMVRVADLNMFDLSMWHGRPRPQQGMNAMADVRVCEVAALDDPGRKVVEIDGQQIGIFRLGEEVFAYENRCPHLDGPVCQGKMLPLALEAVAADGTSSGRVFSKSQMNIICPWHGFEFDIRTGVHPTDKRVRLRRIPVRVTDGAVYVTIR